MPAHHGRAPRTPGPASGSLQGRNPRGVWHRRCGVHYGDCGFAQASRMVVADSEPVTAQLRSRAWSVFGGSNR